MAEVPQSEASAHRLGQSGLNAIDNRACIARQLIGTIEREQV